MLRPALVAIGLFSVFTSHSEPLFVPGQYPTIQAAIDASEHGDEIHIAPGIYRELLDPENKSLTLIGAGPEQTILSGDLDGDTLADGTILNYQNEGADVLPFITLDGIAFEDSDAGLRMFRAAYLDISNCSFTRCDYGIILPYSQYADSFTFGVDVRGSSFQGTGGGMYLTRTLSLTIEDCTFNNMTRQTIYVNTEAFSLSRSTFTRGRDAGASVYTASGSIQDCVFEENAGRSANGHGSNAITMSGSGELKLVRNVVRNNGDQSSEVALRISGGDEIITISDCTFNGNRGNNDSAVHATGILHFDNCSFTHNVANNVGPINFNAATVTPSVISNCVFESNGEIQPDNTYLPRGGGGLCLESGVLVIRNTLFHNNLATTAGAVMFGGYNMSCTIENSQFHGNRSGSERYSSAGAIYVGGVSSSNSLGLTNSVFIGNNAEDGYGGAIVASRRTLVSNCTFIGNKSKNGTIAYLESRHSTILNLQPSIFDSCIAVPIDNAPIFTANNETLDYGAESNLIADHIQSVGFVRIPTHGGDGFGDDPRTPDFDESVNDDYGDLRLLPGSPAIDAGGNAKLPRDIYDLDRDGDFDELLVGFTDLAGNPRFVDDPDAPNLFDSAGLTGPIDLGPYEFQPVAGRPLRR